MSMTNVADSTFSSTVRDFHIYRGKWYLCNGQQLDVERERESNNPEDRFAAAVFKARDSGSKNHAIIL